jgi:hypothetical protein
VKARGLPLDRFSRAAVSRGVGRTDGLCERLIAVKRTHSSAYALQRVGASYASQWRQAFARRLHLAATLAHLAMRPWLAPLVWPILERTPRLVTAVARAAGKARIPPTLEDVPSPGRFASLEDAH